MAQLSNNGTEMPTLKVLCQTTQMGIEFFKLNWNDTTLFPKTMTAKLMSAYPGLVSWYDNKCGGKLTEYINPSINVVEDNMPYQIAYSQHGTSRSAMDLCNLNDYHGIDHDQCVKGYEDGVSGK